MVNDRQSAILSYLAQHGQAKNSDLIALIGDYSSMTLWRDLAKLEQEGQIVRVRGGAVLAQNSVLGQEANFSDRSRQNISAKEEIAHIAIALIHANHAHYLDAGSTIFTLTRLLGEGNYTMITSAANTAAELARHNNYSVTLLGGQVNGSTLSCSGPQAEHMLGGMNIDVAVMATSGYSLNGGFTSGRLTEAQLKQQVIKKSAFTMMLMDHGKIARSHPFTFATLDDIDVLVGDSELPAEFIQVARQHHVQVFIPNDGLSPAERDKICTELFAQKYQ